MKTEGKIYRLLEQTVEEHSPERSREEINRFGKMTALKDAIKTAAESRKEDGTCYAHQRRLFGRPDAIPDATKKLLAAEAKIKACKSFEQLHSLVTDELADVHGIGELYCYDVSVRIGAARRLLPKKIHLHAGVRQGAKLLGLSTDKGYLDVSDMPEILRGFEPFEIEDILCHLANGTKTKKKRKKPVC